MASARAADASGEIHQAPSVVSTTFKHVDSFLHAQSNKVRNANQPSTSRQATLRSTRSESESA